jgi:hypothetical protein
MVQLAIRFLLVKIHDINSVNTSEYEQVNKARDINTQ